MTTPFGTQWMASWRAAVRLGALLGLAIGLPAAAQSGARADTALSGTVLAARNVADIAACQSECKATPGCSGYSFDRNAKANCSLLSGTLVDVAVKGAASCRLPCEPSPQVTVLPQRLPSTILRDPGAPALATKQPVAAAPAATTLTPAAPIAAATPAAPVPVAPVPIAPVPIAPVPIAPVPVTPPPIGVAPSVVTPSVITPGRALPGAVVIAPAPAPAPAALPPGPPIKTTPPIRLLPPAPAPAAAGATVLVGTGISDITGPVAEVVMMGYANTDQSAAGLHMRLYARAFVFAEPGNGRRVVFVSAELGQLFSSVKQGVLKRLAQRFGNLYDDRNVQIAATHTHAGPGGYSHHAIFNFTSAGHVAQNYRAIVDGITEAIVQAHDRLAPATVSMAAGPIREPASVNRATTAFARNPDKGSLPNNDINPEVTVLRIDRGGRPAGAISWFAVHNTSLTNSNVLVSSDHKGWAAYQFEREFGTIAPFQRGGEFVAAFPNGEEGDQSPNILPGFIGPGGLGKEFLSMAIIGDREFVSALAQFQAPNRSPVAGEIDFRHTFVSMPGFAVTTTNNRNGAGGNTLCKGAYGASFAAGAKDGPTNSKLFREGMVLGPHLTQTQLTALRIAFGEIMFATVSPAAGAVPVVGPLLGPMKVAFHAMTALSNDPCQSPKPVLIPAGELGWSPEVLPFQLLRAGPVVIAGIPGEMTVQAGRRLRARILSALGPRGVNRVILTGLANEYSAYITTPEEYDAQLYEGASTLFGRLTLDAYLQIFGQLADAMAAGQPVPPGPTPRDLGGMQIELQTGVVADGVPGGQTFGTVITEPPISVRKNDTVQVRFRGAHPKNDLRRNDTYLRVERNDGGNWTLVAWDSMPETRLIWQRDTTFGCIGCSFIDVHWTVPESARPGSYRIKHMGRWKHGLTGAITPYEGISANFEVGSALVLRAPAPNGAGPSAVTACGGAGQRACCVAERFPSCHSGLQEVGSCAGASCTCGGLNPGGVLKSIGMCAAPAAPPAPAAITACGGVGQRACCTAERFPSCFSGLVERGSCVGASCTCGGLNPGAVFRSIGMCARP